MMPDYRELLEIVFSWFVSRKLDKMTTTYVKMQVGDKLKFA